MTGQSDIGTRFESLVRMAGDAEMTDEALVREVQRALLSAEGAGGQVEVLGPAQADIPFVQALLGPLAANVLYAGARPLLRRLLRAAVEASRAEIVLLDARSGYCDESAAAVLDLADASWVPTRHVGAKVFLGKDIFDGLGTEEQAKYRARAVLLTWKVEDIWRLIVRAMAAASPLFRKQIEKSGLVLADTAATASPRPCPLTRAYNPHRR